MLHKIWVVTFAAITCAGPALGANIIWNGDFELGQVGFSSDYLYTPTIHFEGTYYVGINPILLHPHGASYGDHTTGSGLMLIANGAEATNRPVWEHTVSVLPNSPYIFSGWAASWGKNPDPNRDPSPARLTISINDVPIIKDFLLLATNGDWIQFAQAWQSGEDPAARITIVDMNTATIGNDFTLDDLSLSHVPGTPIPDPGTFLLLGSGLAALAAYSRRRAR